MLRLPTDGPYQVTLEFGNIPGYSLNNGFHKGIDLVSDNKRIYLIEDANIELYPNNGNDGNAIYYSANNRRVAYCHMASFAVGPGFHPAGTYLGQMGDTGAATGVHLHLAIQESGSLVNPRTLIDFNNQGEEPVVDENYANAFYEDNVGRFPTPEERAEIVGEPWQPSYNRVRTSDAAKQYKEYIKQVIKDNDVRAQGVIDLQKLVADLQQHLGDNPQATAKLQQIKSILES